jgi:hypothetical protein
VRRVMLLPLACALILSGCAGGQEVTPRPRGSAATLGDSAPTRTPSARAFSRTKDIVYLAYAQQEAPAYGGDPARIVTYGFSAGSRGCGRLPNVPFASRRLPSACPCY